MQQLGKDDVLTTASILLLLFTAMITWNVTSYLMLLAIVILILARYHKGR